MKRGKKICNILKQIRIDVARENHIHYVPHECHNENNCLGTCPLCEKELQYIENKLEEKRMKGDTIIYTSTEFENSPIKTNNCEHNVNDIDYSNRIVSNNTHSLCPSDCVFPVVAFNKREEHYGTGFLIGNILLTSGHVVYKSKYISFKLNKVLKKIAVADALLLKTTTDMTPNEYDICVFQLDDFYGQLKLSSINPSINTELEVFSFKHEISNLKINHDNVFSNNYNEVLYEEINKGKVSFIDGNFFFCNMNKPLEEGRSGCPIIHNNNVYGLLYGGKDNGYSCIFQSSKSICELLNKHRILI